MTVFVRAPRIVRRWSGLALAVAAMAATTTMNSHAFAAEGASASERATSSDPLPAEIILEERLIAPCCWTQTLAGHESPLASELRHEIHARLAAGQSASIIEQDLVERYGENIRAVPAGRDPRKDIPVVVGVLLAAAGLLLVVLLRRWLTRGPTEPFVAVGSRGLESVEAGAGIAASANGPNPAGATPARDRLDDVIDDELARVEDP